MKTVQDIIYNDSPYRPKPVKVVDRYPACSYNSKKIFYVGSLAFLWEGSLNRYIEIKVIQVDTFSNPTKYLIVPTKDADKVDWLQKSVTHLAPHSSVTEDDDLDYCG